MRGDVVAYSFKQRFVDPIRAGTKAQTIRAPRKRHAHPGEEVQLYYAQRTRNCSLIGVVRCISTPAIVMEFMPHTAGDFVEIGDVGTIAGPALDQFAKLDGFIDWIELRQFWEDEHPGVDQFAGVLIRWRSIQERPLLAGGDVSSAGT